METALERRRASIAPLQRPLHLWSSPNIWLKDDAPPAAFLNEPT